MVIKEALAKRAELSKEFEKDKIDINPLMLIQLPDRIGSLEDEMKNKVISILKDKYHISTENGKLAIWLSGEHVNKENVEKHNSEVDVLIFKQAIALGWDCPRAQILVLFREWHSQIFSIQTVGRIMRMPEPDKGHYESNNLNYSYVYTNLDNIDIKEDMAKDYITIYSSKRTAIYKPVNLMSYSSKRQRERTRLSPLFIRIFLQEAKEYKLKEKIDIKSKKIDLKIIVDYSAEDVDSLVGKPIVADKDIKAGSTDLQKLFDYFTRQHLTPFYPEDRSVGRVKESIYHFFAKELALYYQDNQEDIVQIVLSDKNILDFIEVIDLTKEKYQKETEKLEKELSPKEDWNVPEFEKFNEKYIKQDVDKSIMQSFFSKEDWKSEKAFIERLEKSNKVEWWFKNGERDATYFAVPYKLKGFPSPFYVDFVVKMKDGKIGLFDPHGLHLADAKPKAEGLYNYIQEQNKKGKKLFGGIVANSQDDYSGVWYCFDMPIKDWRDGDIGNWTRLEL